MSHIGKLAFYGGVILAVILGVTEDGSYAGLLPWVVGGLGMLVGLLNVKGDEVKGFLLAGIGLVVALTALLAQPYNPAWLDHILFYVRVFAAHVLLVVALIAVYKAARN